MTFMIVSIEMMTLTNIRLLIIVCNSMVCARMMNVCMLRHLVVMICHECRLVVLFYESN